MWLPLYSDHYEKSQSITMHYSMYEFSPKMNRVGSGWYTVAWGCGFLATSLSVIMIGEHVTKDPLCCDLIDSEL